VSLPAGWLLSGATGGAAGVLLLRTLAGTSAADLPGWWRLNYCGRPVSLVGGPAVVLAGVAGVVAARPVPPRLRAAAAVAGLTAAAVGRYDDRHGAGTAKGFAGHIDALARGRLNSGIVKVVGIGAAGVAAVTVARPATKQPLLAGAVVAGTANMVNLLDVRPGRALKGVLAAGLPALAGPVPGAEMLAGPLGAAAAVLPADLAQRTMLGDAGANGLGALLGLGLVAGAGRRRLVLLLLGLVGLTAASEVVSFTAVIERVPPLRWLDRLGRRPPVE